MLINWHAPKHIYLVCGKTDLRKGIDGLAILVAENYGLELYDDSLFLFCGFRSDRFKGLYWDGEGFILLYKRYENGHLKWPRNSSEARLLKHQELVKLLKGLNPSDQLCGKMLFVSSEWQQYPTPLAIQNFSLAKIIVKAG